MTFSQKKKVLDYLKEHDSITSFEAFEKFKITRLSAVIFDLRKTGYTIKSIWRESKNADGRVTHYTAYALEKEIDYGRT